MSEEKKREHPEEECTRTIRNRDVMLLSNILYMIQDVGLTEQKRQWMQDRLFSMSQHITGMPGGGGQPTGLDEKIAAINELEEKYAKECQGYLRDLNRAETILNHIRSRSLRTFVMMRYVFGIGNNEIMKRLNIKRRKFEQACKAIEQAPDMEHVVWQERFAIKGKDDILRK